MSGEDIFEIIILVATAWGCAGVFLGIGIWAMKRKDPMHFWSGTTVDPKNITDVPAYNRANGRMWMEFSIPFWICGLLGLWGDRFTVAYTVLLCVGSIGGIFWLLWHYHRICKQYFR